MSILFTLRGLFLLSVFFTKHLFLYLKHTHKQCRYKVSTKLPEKSVPAPKKYKTIFVKDTFPCLFNGNPEEKNGVVYYPKVSTKKGETKDDYNKLLNSAGAGTRLLRMVTVTISEV